MSLKMNGSCTSAVFSPGEKYLFTAGDQGEIYQWDLRMTSATRQNCLAKIQDDGNFHTTCIDMSADGNTLATGSKMGTINLFSFDQDKQELNPKPLKQIMNLTTSITDLKFHPSSQLLSYCSKWKKNSVRMVHIPSQTTYQNFPGAAVGILKYGFNTEFSHDGDLMVMGNDEGKVHMWNLRR